MAGIITDGCELPGYIKPGLIPGREHPLHEGLRFTYRPPTRPQVQQLDREIARVLRDDPDGGLSIKAEKMACTFVANHVKSWDLKINKIHAVEVTAENVALMNHSLFSRLYGILRNADVSDTDPETGEVPLTMDEHLGN